MEGSLIDVGVDLDIINRGGAWYSYNGDRIGQGRENAKNYLKENKAVAKAIDGEIRKKIQENRDLLNKFDIIGNTDEENFED